MSVLIVDDEGLVRRILQRVLDLGEETRTAASVEDAVFEAGSWQPAVILLDLYFEGEPKGLDAIPRLLAAAPRTTIIVMTASGDPSLLRKAMELGAWAAVAKDDARKLRALVRAAARQVRLPFVPPHRRDRQ